MVVAFVNCLPTRQSPHHQPQHYFCLCPLFPRLYTSSEEENPSRNPKRHIMIALSHSQHLPSLTSDWYRRRHMMQLDQKQLRESLLKGFWKRPSLLIKNHKRNSPSSAGCSWIWMGCMNCCGHLATRSSARLQTSQLPEDEEAETWEKPDWGHYWVPELELPHLLLSQ